MPGTFVETVFGMGVRRSHMSASSPSKSFKSRTYLGDIQVRLHDEERIRCIRTAGVRIVEKVLDLGECRLPESGASKLTR